MDRGRLRPKEDRGLPDVTVYMSRTFRFSDLGSSFSACPSEEVAFKRGVAHLLSAIYSPMLSKVTTFLQFAAYI